MNWILCGTVPAADFPLCECIWKKDGNMLTAEKIFYSESAPYSLSVQRGTPALVAAVLWALEGISPKNPAEIRAVLVGDTGNGEGSRKLYRYLQKSLPERCGVDGLTFHYLYPDTDGHGQVVAGLEALAAQQKMPLLVADAGFMYVAKMSGYAEMYDVFTPDAGEMAFLADEKAPHPFYTRGFLLAKDGDIPDLIQRAHAHKNCAHHLLIKGKTDRVVCGKDIVTEINSPDVPFMEPIGGTGDMVTGLLTAFLTAGFPVQQACILAARANRQAGWLAKPTPATQVAALMPFLPDAVTTVCAQ